MPRDVPSWLSLVYSLPLIGRILEKGVVRELGLAFDSSSPLDCSQFVSRVGQTVQAPCVLCPAGTKFCNTVVTFSSTLEMLEILQQLQIFH